MSTTAARWKVLTNEEWIGDESTLKWVPRKSPQFGPVEVERVLSSFHLTEDRTRDDALHKPQQLKLRPTGCKLWPTFF